MKNLFSLGFVILMMTACGGQQNSSDSTENELLEKKEIKTLDSIANEAEAVEKEITKKAEKLDSLIKNLDN